MNAAEIARLKEIAQAATPGPWKSYWRTYDNGVPDCGVFAEQRPGMAYSVARCPRYQTQGQWEADAVHIAAFDPPTVLSLLASLEQSQAALAEAQDHWRKSQEAYFALLAGCGCKDGAELATKAAAHDALRTRLEAAKEALKETLAVAIRNEEGGFADRARAAIAEMEK